MKSFKLALVSAILLSSFTAQAKYYEKHLMIVTLNTKEIIEKSLHGKEIQKKINDEQASVTATFPAMEAAIKAKDTALAQQQNNYNEKVKSLEAKTKMISDEARNKEIDALQDIRRQIEETTAERERLIRKFNEEAKRAEQRLEALYKKEMMAFEAEIRAVIESVSQSEEWDLVFKQESCIFASERTDRTAMIISKLDEAELKRKETKQAEKKVATPAAAVKKTA